MKLNFPFLLCINAVVILLISSCKPYSPAKFESPQPAGSENIPGFPQKLTGVFQNEDASTTLTISAQNIISKYEADFAEHKDSLSKYFIISADTLTDKDSGEKFKFSVKNDSAYWHHSFPPDSIFSLANGNVLRKLRGNYFLNTKTEDGFWNVQKLSLSGNKLTISQIADSADLAKLKQITETENDSSDIFKPSRKRFKKYVRNDGFSSRKTFYRLKN